MTPKLNIQVVHIMNIVLDSRITQKHVVIVNLHSLQKDPSPGHGETENGLSLTKPIPRPLDFIQISL